MEMNVILLLYFSTNELKCGMAFTQGPHHVDQNSKTIGLSLILAISMGLFVHSVISILGAIESLKIDCAIEEIIKERKSSNKKMIFMVNGLFF